MSAWYLLQRAVALASLLVAAPVLGLLGVAIRIDSPGPTIYRARRVGTGGRSIVVHKLRTMRHDARAPGAVITAPDDERITRLGGWLRSRRLDELPQLWDVALGRMALVGPRPETPEFVDLADPVWREVLSVRPGITGAAQLEFHDEARLLAAGPEDAYRHDVLPAKLAIDLAYVRHRSVRRDLRILVATAGLALGSR